MWQEALMGGGDDWYNVILITAPAGASIDVDDGDEQITAVGTGSQQAIAIHNENSTYAITVVASGFTKTDSVTTGTTSGVVVSKSFNYGLIELTFDNDFRSQSFSITDGTSTATGTFPASGNTIDIDVPNIGSWTISSTVSGDTFESVISVTDLDVPVSGEIHVRPDGKTVTPTDDIQTWLECAGVKNKPYTTLEEVLGDKETLQILISDQNAVDYMVRSKTWIKQITVPVMTSDTAPKGHVSYSSQYNATATFAGYAAFDQGTDMTKGWMPNDGAKYFAANVSFIAYEFDDPVDIHFGEFLFEYEGLQTTIAGKFQAWDGTNWIDVSNEFQFTTDPSNERALININTNGVRYQKYRWFCTSIPTQTRHYGIKLQFYSLPKGTHGITEDSTAMRYIGKRNYAADTLLADVNPGLVPMMTDDTHPSGEAVSSPIHQQYYAYYAFDGNSSTFFGKAQNTTNAYVGYDFGSPTIVRCITMKNSQHASNVSANVKVKGSTDGITWQDVSPTLTLTDVSANGENTFVFTNETAYQYYALFALDDTLEFWNVASLQFYAKPVDEPQWIDGICGSEYIESVLNIKVPTLTSDSGPDGGTASGGSGCTNAFQAFDGDDSTRAHKGTADTNSWIQYEFGTQVDIRCFDFCVQYGSPDTITLQLSYSDDGISFIDIGSSKLYDATAYVTPLYIERYILDTNNFGEHKYWRLKIAPTTARSNLADVVQFYGREDVDESYIDIYSAASDNDIHYMSGSTPVTVAGTDPNGKGSVSRSFLPNGDYDLYSSVAMDPNGDLSTEYHHKRVKVTNSTIEIMLMPDDTIYWYGFDTGELEHVSSGNGWSTGISAASVQDTTTDGTNYFNKPTTSQGIGGRGTKVKKSADKFCGILDALQLYNGNAGNIAVTPNKILGGPSSQLLSYDSLSQLGLKRLMADMRNLDDEYYLSAFSYHTSAFNCYALWTVRHNPAANFFSAANDTVYYMSSGVQVVVAQTNELGEAVVNLSNIPTGVTLYSSVAKDPDSLATTPTDFSKVFNGPDANGKFYLMPESGDKMLYWYGWENGMEDVTAANGWSRNGYTLKGVDHNIQDITTQPSSAGSTNISGYGSKEALNITNVHFIAKGITYDTGQDYGDIRTAATKNFTTRITATGITSTSEAYYTEPVGQSAYIACTSWGSSKATYYAVWYD